MHENTLVEITIQFWKGAFMKKKRKMISSLVAFMLLLNCLGTMSSAAAEPDMECSNDSKFSKTE